MLLLSTNCFFISFFSLLTLCVDLFVYIIICSFEYAYQDCKKYKLGDPRSFHYLNQSNCIALDGLDDSKEYMETRRAMGIVGMSSDEQVKPRFCQQSI
jgi:hypothetical protein